jgi:hypothetical protein
MKTRHQYVLVIFAVYGTALLLPFPLHAASTCLEENGRRTCCDAWIADTREGTGKGVIREKTIEALQHRIAESIRINRNWCNSVPTSEACDYQVSAPRCDGPTTALSAEERQHLINSARLLVSEWEIRLEEAIAAQRGPNPYLGVGRVAKSYALALADAQEKLKMVKSLLGKVYGNAGSDVTRRLDAARKEFEQSLTRVKLTQKAAMQEAAQAVNTANSRTEPVADARRDSEARWAGPGTSGAEFHEAEGSASCPDLNHCLRVEDAIWDPRSTSDGGDAGTMTVTLANTCSSALRLMLSAHYFDQERKTYYDLGPGETASHSVQATQNHWVATASQRSASNSCLDGLK